MALLLVGCAKEYDDSGLKERVSALETRVTALESNVQALQSAIGEGVFVAKVQEYADPDTGKTIGVTVTYTNGDVKYFQISPKDDVDAPVLGVIQSGSGALVWAIDGVAILIDGEEVPVYQTPVFTIDDDGNLWVEVDGKKTKLGQVQNEGATLVDGIFTDIKVEQDKVVLTLSDETKVNIPFAEAFKIELMLDECVYTEAEPIPVHYAITAATAGTVVRVAGYNPFDFSVAVNNEEKIIEITPLTPGAAAQLLIVADSGIGLVSTATLLVEPEGIKVVDAPATAEYDYIAEGEGGVVTAHVVTNIAFEVKPVDEWIHLVDVKATAYTVTLSLDDNTTGEVRTGMVNILRKGTDEVLQTIIIGQLAAEIEEGPANLSKKESANSYLVYAPGEYKFKAVKGNSEESVGEVASVEILWETVNTGIAPEANSVIAAVGFKDDFVTFSTPETLVPGNALIAAKDANGVILWSWHIWIPATEIVNSTYGDIVSVPMMDRDLGALVAPDASEAPNGRTIGFLYQWGRKDPFPAIADISSSTPFATNGTISLTSEKQNFTVAETIQNPTVYVVTGGDSNKTWMTTEEMGGEYWAAEKAIYDPCPPGYIVPSREASGPLWKGEATCTVDETNKWVKAGNTEVALFPVSGYLDQGSITKVGSRSYHWTSVQSADKNIAYMLYANGSSVTVEVQRMSRGGNVRCVVANEAAIVPPTPTEGGGEVVSSAIDLSAQGTANSYIVTAAGNYTFKTVKGNSKESVGTVASAEILWETENTETAPEAGSIIASVSYEEGYVTFSTPETLKAGNALIAVKDVEGTILWSWHIWIPQTEIATMNYGIYSKPMMDRNLGALVAAKADEEAPIESYGLLYQWGRKDPFPGAKSNTSGSFAKLTPDLAPHHPEAHVHDDGGNEQCLITLEQSIQDPLLMGHSNSGAWLTPADSTLWVNEAKTMFDPCPPGYRVPAYESESAMHSDDLTNATGWSESKDNKIFTMGDPAAVFPFTGYLDDYNPADGVSKNGLRVVYWTAKNWPKSKIAGSGMNVRETSAGGNKHKIDGAGMSRAGSVRCVAE